jgi:hypothetical protein
MHPIRNGFRPFVGIMLLVFACSCQQHSFKQYKLTIIKSAVSNAKAELSHDQKSLKLTISNQVFVLRPFYMIAHGIGVVISPQDRYHFFLSKFQVRLSSVSASDAVIKGPERAVNHSQYYYTDYETREGGMYILPVAMNSECEIVYLDADMGPEILRFIVFDLAIDTNATKCSIKLITIRE